MFWLGPEQRNQAAGVRQRKDIGHAVLFLCIILKKKPQKTKLSKLIMEHMGNKSVLDLNNDIP